MSVIWHKSFGHHNFNSLMMLHDNVLVEGMPEIPASKQMSEGCEYGKQHQKPFPQFTSNRALNNLQLVHSNICEPMNIAFLKIFAYFMLFKDEYNRMIWARFLKNKSQVFSEFENFKCLTETLSDLSIGYSKTGGVDLNWYADSDWAKHISMAAAENWLNKLLADLGQKQVSPTKFHCDNKSSIEIADNPVQHGRTKHINVKLHFLREAEKNWFIKVLHCSNNVQLADLMTKEIPGSKLEFLKMQLRLFKANLKEEC